MAHMISHANGKAEMAYRGETPWHGLGTPILGDATVREAHIAAHLDWSVALRPLLIRHPADYNQIIGANGFFGVTREDNGYVMGVVSDSYVPLQNHEQVSFLDRITEGRPGAKIETCGALHGGRVVFTLVSLPGEIRIKGGRDVSKQYLLVVNHHDGMNSVKVYFTTVRVVCQNTLSASSKDVDNGFKVRHRGDVVSEMDKAYAVLTGADSYFERQGKIWEYLSEVRCTENMMADYANSILGIESGKEPSARMRGAKDRMTSLFASGPGQDWEGVSGTMWAALNAATDYADHYKSTRGDDDQARAENRMLSSLSGDAAGFKARAYETIMTMANVPDSLR